MCLKTREASIGMGVEFCWHGRRHSVGMSVDNEAKLLGVKKFKQQTNISGQFGP